MNHHIARDGQQLGVFAEEEIKAGLITGRFQADDLCWAEGMADWQPVSAKFSAPAPLVSPAAGQPAGGFNPYAAPTANVMTKPSSNVVLADLGRRLGAAILDGLTSGLVMGVPYVVLMLQLDAGDKSRSAPEFNNTAIAALIIMILGGLALLVINLILLTKRGQTLGKMWLGIRIVTHPDSQNPGFVKAFLLRAFVNGIISAVPCLGPIYSLVDICFVFREDRRCIHDLIAGTQVIEGQPPKA